MYFKNHNYRIIALFNNRFSFSDSLSFSHLTLCGCEFSGVSEHGWRFVQSHLSSRDVHLKSCVLCHASVELLV